MRLFRSTSATHGEVAEGRASRWAGPAGGVCGVVLELSARRHYRSTSSRRFRRAETVKSEDRVQVAAYSTGRKNPSGSTFTTSLRPRRPCPQPGVELRHDRVDNAPGESRGFDIRHRSHMPLPVGAASERRGLGPTVHCSTARTTGQRLLGHARGPAGWKGASASQKRVRPRLHRRAPLRGQQGPRFGLRSLSELGLLVPFASSSAIRRPDLCHSAACWATRGTTKNARLAA